jgi:hypothetical protein
VPLAESVVESAVAAAFVVVLMKLVVNATAGAETVTDQVRVLRTAAGDAFDTVVIVYTYVPSVFVNEGVTEIFVRPDTSAEATAFAEITPAVV